MLGSPGCRVEQCCVFYCGCGCVLRVGSGLSYSLRGCGCGFRENPICVFTSCGLERCVRKLSKGLTVPGGFTSTTHPPAGNSRNLSPRPAAPFLSSARGFWARGRQRAALLARRGGLSSFCFFGVTARVSSLSYSSSCRLLFGHGRWAQDFFFCGFEVG